jgi:Zn-dependent alcohol dehydrogenase
VPLDVRAAVLRSFGGPHDIVQVWLREPGPGEVLVAIACAGVCHSDVGQADGEWDFPLPAVLGHEGSGVVEAVGPGVSAIAPGDRVVLNLAPGCGHCRHCMVGRPILCQASLEAMGEGRLTTGPSPIVLDDAPVAAYSLLACFAERAVVAQESVIPIPEDVPADVAALIGCAVITGLGAAIETLKVPAGSAGAVIGVGGVGINAVLGASLAGAETIVAIDPSPDRRQRAFSFGATEALDPSRAPEAAELRRRAASHGFDWTIVTVGAPEGISLGIETVRPGGTACIVGLAPQGAEVPVNMLDLVTYERTIVGSAYGSLTPRLLVPRIIELYRQGRLPLHRLISDRFGLEEIDAAFAKARRSEGLRSILEIA